MKEKLQNPKKVIDLEKHKKSEYWSKIGEIEMINLFHRVARNVPAYGKFLKENGIVPRNIRSLSDFKALPTVSKKIYLTRHPLNDLLWGGNLNKPLVFTATSGSTGEPFYFMRQQLLDWQYSIMVEEYLYSGLRKNKGPTLVLVCFGMGVWIAGLITYKAFEQAAIRNNLGVSILTPGINKKEIFYALQKLAPYYSQTIIVGYPPFVRDIIDEAVLNEINLEKLNIRVLFAAEAISENFRKYIGKKAHIDNIYLDTMSIYGSADIGAMATETTTGILIRQIAEKNKKIFNELFHSINKHPTLAQFNPLYINFESINGEIALTGNSALPLVRYKIGDNGGVLSFSEVDSILRKHNINIYEEARKLGLKEYVTELPFVYIYERTDLATSFYGLWIYPEWFRTSLLKRPLSDLLTGKFTLITKTDKKQNQYLEINLELQKGRKVNSKVKQVILDTIVSSLKANSSEYRELCSQLNGRAKPRLQFWPAEDPMYFQPGAKQKWVKQMV